MLYRNDLELFNMLAVSLLACLAPLTLCQLSDIDRPSPHAAARVPNSPCPGVFTYDAREAGAERWYGVVQLSTSVKLVGFNLDIKLDKPAELLGNWQGVVETEDNLRFSVTSETKKINPGPSVPLRIFVKHGQNPAPNIISIKLNGRKICPKSGAATTRLPVHTATSTTTTTTTSTTTQRPLIRVSTARQPSGNAGAATTKKPNAGFAGVIGATTKKPQTASGGNIECGKVQVQAQALITHGQGTERGQWPWHVAMYKNKGKDLSYICGGSLIGRKAVVTAAHCVTKRPSDRADDPDTFVLYFGKYHLLLWSDGGVQNKQIQDIIVHPSYNSSNFRSDLAVLTLKSPVDFTEFVRPVCLWNPSKTDLSEVEGKEGIVVGWGFDETGVVSQELMLAKMPVASQQACLWSYPDFFSHFTSNMTFCAGFRNGTSVCNGDSGGGMVFPIKQRDNSNVWFLRGLVSLSPSKENERVCDTSHYVVFTDLAKYVPWLTPYVNTR